MDTTDVLADLVTRMNRIKAEHGEEAWLTAMKQFARDCLTEGGQMRALAEKMFENIDPRLVWADIVREFEAEKVAQQAAPDMGLFMRALQQQLPGLKSQGQFTAFQGAFEAFRAVCNAILTRNKEGEASAKEALGQGFEALRIATDITQKLEDVPEAGTSAAAEEFKRPPAEFGEYDVQRALLSEVASLSTLSELNEWYSMNRQRFEQVRSPQLRNPLFDLIRAKKAELAQGGQA